MLILSNVKKDYVAGDSTVTALKGVSLVFRKNEFVSIVGPSGCGKTTMLNIIGGLDKYTDGDLIINGVSTKEYRDIDWDAYRNRSIGFVFQSYNLIPHLSVLGNVELALTLSGIGKAERKRLASEALEKVGLKEQINKRPNQLSGGQMQRVSIARAIVNKPDIILADEPTGALDSATSVQIMDLLKEIAKDKLVIMVTHNLDLADQYSDRIISILDGEIIGDTNPYSEAQEAAERGENEVLSKTAQNIELISNTEESKAENGEKVENADTEIEAQPPEKSAKSAKKAQKMRVKAKKQAFKKTSMSFVTALSLSGRNLLTKKARTFLTAFAGSIGIIGIALVLSLSNGFSNYLDEMQDSTLTELPVEISRFAIKPDALNMGNMMGGKKDDTDYGTVIVPEEPKNDMYKLNKLTADYIEYVKKLDSELYKSITYGRQVGVNIFFENSEGAVKQIVNPNSTADIISGGYLQELSPNSDYLDTQFKKLAGDYPTSANQVCIIVGKDNKINTTALKAMGINDTESFEASTLLGKKYKWIHNDDYYKYTDEFGYIPLGSLPEISQGLAMKTAFISSKGLELEVVGVMKINDESMMPSYGVGFGYTEELTQHIIDKNTDSTIGQAQLVNKGISVLGNQPFGEYSIDGIKIPLDMQYNMACINLGAMDLATSIAIYPKDFKAKEKIVEYLNAYNDGLADEDQILYTDYAAIVTSTVNTMIDSISIVLIVFAAISLVVSSIMIAIITYVSVIERTKEIGVLRSIGARKKDISRVFNAETFSIGLVSGILGVILAAIIDLPINAIIKNLVPALGGVSIAVLNPLHALIMIVLSVALTLVSGLIPARIASKKDPVVALRTE